MPHVMRYYSGGGWFTGLFGNGQFVTIAKSQLGNEGGEKFWSWYGFDSREEWCACFVSWCADQAGLIQNGAVPKFSLCTAGVDWFQAQGKWQGAGSVPSPGMIIFLIGIMTDAVTMWESWKAAMELRYIRLKETAEMQ